MNLHKIERDERGIKNTQAATGKQKKGVEEKFLFRKKILVR